MDDLTHTSIASLAPDLSALHFGLSKSHMIAGFRVGWMILFPETKEIAKDYIEGIKMLSSTSVFKLPAQSIVQTALGGTQSVNEYVKPNGRVTRQRILFMNGCLQFQEYRS